MSKRLEDFIKANKEEFDTLEPPRGIWGNIEERLPEHFEPKVEKKTFSLGFVLRVAAAVIVVMTVSFVFYLHNEKQNGGINLAAINPEYAKQQVQYASLITTKRTELKRLAQSVPELYNEFSAELTQMDITYKKLKTDLATSPNQELVLHAMIRNLQAQAAVLNQQLMIIEQFNQMKKDQQNETKSI